ncbi:MAG: transcription termination/antitermination protein NusG [Planctomycetaceae bacterium]|jgi:transcriptional antiterminator NusG|nr:transcription termination/antitermination protein NusG [Planctomycetaceae bacterium]
MVDQYDENHDETIQETRDDKTSPIVETVRNDETSGQKKKSQTPEKPEIKQPDSISTETESEESGEKMDWYILKVQVNREDVIKESLKRKVQISGLQHYFDRILVPSEKVTEVRGGKKRIIRKKLYPGYIMIRMVVNDDTWFLVRETSGIGDFTGSIGRPTPMLQHEVERILATEEEEKSDAPKLKIPYEVGGLVKIKEGTFVNFEGEVSAIDKTSGRVTVMLSIFGRSTPVELEYWQVELLQ